MLRADDDVVIAQVLAGRTDVFRHLVDRYQDSVFRVIRRLISSLSS